MIKLLYDSWQIIIIVSTAVGLISALILFAKYLNTSMQKHIIIRIIGTSFVITSVVMVSLAAVVKSQFTEVPRAYGMTVNEAETKLSDSGLQMALPPGINRDESWMAMVVGQSIDEYSIVPRRTTITVFLKTDQSTSDESGMVKVPNVVGLEQAKAIEMLTETDMQYQVWWTEENNDTAEQYYVISQSIPQGTEIQAGTMIKIELSSVRPETNG